MSEVQPPVLGVGYASQSHFQQFGGMDSDMKPFLLGPEKWKFLQNVRTYQGLVQVPAKFPLAETSLTGVEVIANFLSGDRDFGTWVLVAKDKVTALALSTTPVDLITGLNPTEDRWHAAMYNDAMFFVNPENRVRYCDGATVKELFNHRAGWTKANGFEFLGDGPFTRIDATDGTLEENTLNAGDLGAKFTWTTGGYYRVYHTKNEWFYQRLATVKLERYTTAAGVTTLTTLLGQVMESRVNYIIVRATNTVANVSNRRQDSGWLVTVTDMEIPKGRYVRVFYDHVVVGAPSFQGNERTNAAMWSNLVDFADWIPRVGNEADSYTFTDQQRLDSVVSGCTGMEPYKQRTLSGVHEILVLFTPSCIYQLTYTGLPRVMKVSPLIEDYGNGLMYATATLDDSVVWVDVHHMDFFAYRGQGPESIGQGIRTYFFSDLNPDSDLAQRTYAYVDRAYFEVVWVYVSRNSTHDFDKAVAYNYRNHTWSVRTVEGMTGFGRVQRRALVCNELTGTAQNLIPVNAKLDRSTDVAGVFGSLYADAVGKLWIDENVFATLPVVYPGVKLETGDFTYGSMGQVKELKSILINAQGQTLDPVNNPFGIDVYVQASESIDRPGGFIHVGFWTPTIQDRTLTFKPLAGKVFRYIFQPVVGTFNFSWSGFEDNVRMSTATR
jgi:hypothetical protein